MSIELGTPGSDALDDAVAALRDWQVEGAPLQLHPGDVGWARRDGDGPLAASVRVWRRDGRAVAFGMLDGPVLRLTVAPDVRQDAELARRLRDDLSDPSVGVLPGADASVELPVGLLLRAALAEAGWTDDEAWTPLHRDLTDPVEDPGLRIEVVGPSLVAQRVAVHRAVFARSTFTAERWHALAATPTYRDARCLLAHDAAGNAVAATTVWSAGRGRPGLIEPLGVDPAFRGAGHGRAITLAAAAALRDLGASSVLVCTPSSNTGGVATYVSAGLRPQPERLDLRRPA